MHKSEDWPIVYTLFAMSAAQGWRCAAGGRVIFWSNSITLSFLANGGQAMADFKAQWLG